MHEKEAEKGAEAAAAATDAAENTYSSDLREARVGEAIALRRLESPARNNINHEDIGLATRDVHVNIQGHWSRAALMIAARAIGALGVGLGRVGAGHQQVGSEESSWALEARAAGGESEQWLVREARALRDAQVLERVAVLSERLQRRVAQPLQRPERRERVCNPFSYI